jgi:hypothetical protein
MADNPGGTPAHTVRKKVLAARIRNGGSIDRLDHRGRRGLLLRVVSRIFRTFGLAERRPALAHAVTAPLIYCSFSNSMFRYLLVDHAVPAMWRSLAAARLSAD